MRIKRAVRGSTPTICHKATSRRCRRTQVPTTSRKEANPVNTVNPRATPPMDA